MDEFTSTIKKHIAAFSNKIRKVLLWEGSNLLMETKYYSNIIEV